MTQEEKARAYDEAFKKAQCWLNDPQTIQDCNYTIEDAIQNIFPGLRESEDERIIRTLFSLCKDHDWLNGATKEECINWLEKQKEPVVDKEGMYYYLGGKFIYCGYPPTEENPYDLAMSQQEKQKEPENTSASTMIPSFHEELTEFELVLFNAVLDNNFVGAKGSENALAMTKKVAPELLAIAKKEPDWDREKCFVCQEYEKGFKQGHLEGCTAGYNKAMKEVDEQKEQKPIIQDVELNDAVYDYVRDHFIAGADFTPEYIKKLMENAFFAGVDYYLLKQEFESSEPDTNVEKVIEDVIRVYGKTQGEWVGGYDVDTLIVNLRRAFNKKEQKPVEWSEEDINDVIERLKLAYRETKNEMFLADIMRLKSLRPSWKPSEEQMKALQNAVALAAGNKVLAGLYEHLLKSYRI